MTKNKDNHVSNVNDNNDNNNNNNNNNNDNNNENNNNKYYWNNNNNNGSANQGATSLLTYVSPVAGAGVGPVPPVSRDCVECVQRKEGASVLIKRERGGGEGSGI